MENFEVVRGLSDFTKSGDVFLVPIISSGIICLLIFYLERNFSVMYIENKACSFKNSVMFWNRKHIMLEIN